MMTVNPDPTVLLLRLLPLGNNRKLTHVQRHLAVSSFYLPVGRSSHGRAGPAPHMPKHAHACPINKQTHVQMDERPYSSFRFRLDNKARTAINEW